MKKLLLFASLVTLAPAVRAADEPAAESTDESSEESTDGDKGDAEEGGEETPAADAAAAPAEEAAPTEETIFVVQGKPFLVAGKFGLSPQIAQSVNDSFTSHTGLLASGIYHLKENVAFELTGGVFGWWDVGGPRLGGRDSELTVELREKESLAPERVKLYQFPWFLAGDAQWSPLYGKVSVHDIALGQFNLYLSVGAGIFGMQLESLTQNGVQKSYVTLPGSFGVDGVPTATLSTSFGGGMRFYFTDWLGVRLEVRDYVLPVSVRETDVDDADGPSFDVTNLVLGQAGVSFIF